ncbi:MAG: sigma-70 family RNA polymerase sigma factor [Nannocystales bacterium]
MTSSAAPSQSAFRGLYDEHHAFVWAVLRKLGVPERDAEDVMQEVFLVVHRRLGAFEGRSAWTTWLYGITTRVYWNYARRLRSRPQASSSASSLRLVDPSADPERFAQRREASAMLEALLGSLDVDKRTAYVLHIEGLSAPQISAITGVKTRTVYSRLRAAKAEVEASARRVQARARNDDAVRRLAQRSTAHPPKRLRARGWAALALRSPELAGSLGGAASTTTLPWVGVLGGVAMTVFVVLKSGAEPSAPTLGPVVAEVASPERPVSTARATSAPAVPAPASAVPASVAASRVPASPAPRARVRSASPKHTATAHSPEPVLGPLPRARIELKAGRAADALALLKAHARVEPDSPLATERTAMMLLALCSLDRVDEAKALVEADSAALPASCVATPSR